MWNPSWNLPCSRKLGNLSWNLIKNKFVRSTQKKLLLLLAFAKSRVLPLFKDSNNQRFYDSARISHEVQEAESLPLKDLEIHQATQILVDFMIDFAILC